MSDAGRTANPPTPHELRIRELVARLAEVERAIREETSEQADAILDPASATPILLRAAQEALVESEARYRKLVTRISALVFELTPEGATLFVNGAAERLTGYEPGEILGRNWWELFFPGSRGAEAAALVARLRGGDVAGEEVSLTARDGSAVTFELSSANRYGPGGELEAVTCFAVDVTARRVAERERERLHEAERRAREAAEAANRFKDEFLMTVSHELRTPLSAVIGWLKIFEMERADEDMRARALATIGRNVRAQAQIIEDLLDISRIQAGKLRIEPKPVDLSAVVRNAAEGIRPIADAKGVTVASEVEPAVLMVDGDGDRLQQVVWNLLSNAIKFTPAGGRVTARLGLDGGEAVITVEDTGQGIDPGFLPQVFDRFRQADGSTSRAHNGLGLGLAIVRELVALHGGAVSAASDGPGAGAVFTVRLPLPTSAGPGGGPEDAAAPPADVNCPPRLDGVRALVVDDDPDAREMLAVVLGHCGAETRLAASAAEAREEIGRWRPDVLISDIGMPGEDGYELIRSVRARAKADGGAIPAIALTAFARTEDRLRALSEGFQMHVPKPVEPAELVAVVASLLGRR